MARKVFLAAAIASATANVSRASSDCTASSFKDVEAFGTRILNISASTVAAYGGLPDNEVCQVTISLIHPGAGDVVKNYYALPLIWNERFQGVGGGGFAAGDLQDLPGQAALGYACGATDAGHNTTSAASGNASEWALRSPGVVNQELLLNFARRSLHDMTVMGKAVTEAFYGKSIQKSYWSGCSTGGRQGLAFAQYYPEDYDGILATAPAIQWNDFLPAELWPYVVQNVEGYTVSACEFEVALTAAIDACDGLDGVHDGVISAPGICNFKASSIAGKQHSCSHNNATAEFSKTAAKIIDMIWEGPISSEGERLWFGLTKGTNFSGLSPEAEDGAEGPQPFEITASWAKNFLAKNLGYDLTNLDYDNFPNVRTESKLQYDSIIGTASPDLRRFRDYGGKMITWHGLADQLIFPQGSIYYYNRVKDVIPDVQGFYRQFYAPGVGHCRGGIGPIPVDPLLTLRAWVENGTAPEILPAASVYELNGDVSAVVDGGIARRQNLCAYPEVSEYKGAGDPASADSYRCKLDTRGWLEFPALDRRGYMKGQ
ncbi:hypothetical protein D0869_11918 [Hortaea werneckii]|uniref:Carboxylic ester hydrolase n=1 Tax=Hortaea werneckii TaxID=91943 RepID=A0A3M6W9H3_HORWE|nr:putative feruloyl esterase [Hortaea werneckii]KAI7581421.1 putative feruloyl esterase [Hortaea werneckii]RMX75125.1 hypothetical protein D0869_11918 [Hortaea werneckii]